MYSMSLAVKFKKALETFMEEVREYDGFLVTQMDYKYQPEEENMQLVEAIFFPNPKLNRTFLTNEDIARIKPIYREYMTRTGKNPCGGILLLLEVDQYGLISARLERGIGTGAVKIADSHFREFNHCVIGELEDKN